MFSRNRDSTHESGTVRRNRPDRSQRPRCVFFKGTSSSTITGRGRGINISGVDFWHAVEFSRNGRFLCTHPRDSLRLSSGRFPSVLRFRLYQTVFRSDFLGAFQVSAFAFPFPATPTLSEVLSRNFRPIRVSPDAQLRRVPPGRSRKRTGAGRPDANRGAPLRVDACEVSSAGQTSTTTGRIIGLRR